MAILSKGKVAKVGTVEEIKEATGTKTFENAFIKLLSEGENE